VGVTKITNGYILSVATVLTKVFSSFKMSHGFAIHAYR